MAYVDSSCFVALALGEPGAAEMNRRLGGVDRLVSSNLLEAEVRAALARDKVEFSPDLVSAVGWVLPSRALTPEISRVAATGYVRGADLWHLACALYFEDQPSELTFLTLDKPQRDIARRLGFAT